MMTAVELAEEEELRTKAIALLLTERQAIDAALACLGHNGAHNPRPKKCRVCGQVGHTARSHKNKVTTTEGS